MIKNTVKNVKLTNISVFINSNDYICFKIFPTYEKNTTPIGYYGIPIYCNGEHECVSKNGTIRFYYQIQFYN